jgi:hypothetical protein
MNRLITSDKAGALLGIPSKLALALAASVAVANGAVAQTPAYPPATYADLLFDPAEVKHVFRLDGMPWICRGDTFCKPVKIDGVADKDLKLATIEPLGYAGKRYFLSYSQANLQKGRPIALACEDTRCEKLDSSIGPTSALGVYQVKDGDRVQTRTALLRHLDERKGRAQLLWCSERDCSEMPLTRDGERFLLYMGTGHRDGQNVAWLRDRSGEALSCAQTELGVSDQLTCTESTIRLSDFPTPQQAAVPAPAPAVPAPPSNADRNALASAIDQAIAAGDFAYADRLLADANRRFARDATWTPLQQKLTRARAERDAQIRRAEAQRLIDEAWRFARVGEFASAEAMLQDADKQAPGFADIARARQEIAELRTERRQRYRERYQYQAAIDEALTNEQFWEAERLLGDYGQRFSQDDEYRSRARRLDQMRNAATWQARLTQARGFIANARQAMTRNEFAEAERQLERADRAAPGFPEINQARAELSRRRIVAERQQDEMRLLIAAIEASFQRRQYDEAERAIADGRRRYAGYPVWDELQGRSVAARRGDDRQGAEQRARTVRAMELVTAARRSTTQGDFAAAERALTEANTLAPRLPELASANAELERAKADRARQATEIKAIQVLIDAALQRKQYADAERLLADATKRYPTEESWAPRSARLADERRATPGQTGNAPMPAPAPATGAAQPPATPGTPTAAAPKPDPSKPVADAKAAIAHGDFPAAETAVSAAEKIDAKAPTVIAVRKELNIARLVATARNNIRRQNLEAAEKAVVDAEKIDAKDATVVRVRAELAAAEDAAKNAPQQQRPNRRRD